MAIFNEAYIIEALSKNELKFNGKDIKIEIDKSVDEKDINIFYNKFNQIMGFVANKFYKYYKEYCKDDEPIKAWKKSTDVLNDMVIHKISLEKVNSSKYDTLVFAHINCDLNKNILSKIHDDHIPSIDVYIKNHKIKMEEEFFDCYWDG